MSSPSSGTAPANGRAESSHGADHKESSPQFVEHKGQIYPGLHGVQDVQLDTLRVRSTKGLLPAGAKSFMPLLHGMGPMTSHSGSMFATLNVLTASKKKTHRSKSLKALKELPHYQLVGAEAIDLPGCHARPVPDELQSLDALVEWLAGWLVPLKESLDVPLVPIARSAAVAPILELNQAYPDLLSGVILLSPMVPFDTEHSNADLLRRVEACDCELNRVAFGYMNRLVEQTNWDERDDPFAGLPTLILTGGQDTQVSDRVRQRCREWSDRLAHVEFFNLEENGHDVFNLRDRAAGLQAFELVYRFLADDHQPWSS